MGSSAWKKLRLVPGKIFFAFGEPWVRLNNHLQCLAGDTLSVIDDKAHFDERGTQDILWGTWHTTHWVISGYWIRLCSGLWAIFKVDHSRS